MKRKPKILWHSEIVANTGFTNVSRSLIEHLKSSFDITVLEWTRAFTPEFERGRGKVNGSELFYRANGYRLIGKKSVTDTMALERLDAESLKKYDVFFILNDVWNIGPVLKRLQLNGFKGKVVCYFPVDAAQHDPDWYKHFDIVDKAITYTDFAYQEVLKAAPNLKDRLCVLPHGTNFDVFYALAEDKKELRKMLWPGETGIQLSDSFIFLNANRNQPRKRLDITMRAFGLFAEDKEDVALYMHCGNEDNSMNIVKLAERYGFVKKLIITDGAFKGVPKVASQDLNLLYNVCDVGLNTSLGEGWGLTNTEMAAVGKPQIVPMHSACKELFESTGVVCACEADYTQDNIMTVGKIVSTESVAVAMQKLYSDRAFYTATAAKTKKKFTQKRLNWKNIAKSLENILS